MKSSRNRRRFASLSLAALLGITLTLAFAPAVSAQVVSDPRIAEFDPSPDHWDVLASGQPAVVRYELGMYMVGASAPFTTVDLGKPSPDPDGKIRHDFSSAVTGWPLPGGNYEARVSAVGPEGVALSDPSNPFTFTTGSSCTITLSATTSRVPAAGGAYTVDVSTGAGCAWTVTSSLSWVTLWSAGGSGSGTAPFEVQANSSTSGRTGTLTIGGQTLTLSQDGAPAPTCSYSLSPASANLPAAGGNASFVVTAGTGCAWTAATSQSWVTLTGASGTGNGSVSVAVAANTATATRSATVTVQGQTFTVTQAAAAPPCTYSLSPASANLPATGGNASFLVTAGTGCAWTAATSQSWVTLTGASGTGNGSVSVAVAANTATATRSATVTVQGQTFTVTQAAAAPPCTYSLSPASANLPATGGNASFLVTAGTGCAWTAATSQSWVTLTGASGTGNGSVSVAVAANTATATRSATVTVQGQTFTVTQAAAAPTCTYSLSPASANLPATGGNASFLVTAGTGCAWTAATSQSWVTLTGASGTGNGSVSVAVAANTATATRSATVTVQGQTFTVTQAAPAPTCSYSVSPTFVGAPAVGASYTVDVYTGEGCTWTVVPGDSWLLTSAGSGAGSAKVVFSAKPNNSIIGRTSKLAVGPWAVTVSQSGKPRRTK